MKNKNKKERFEEYVKSKNLKGEEIIIVGDAPEEVEIARELGAISIAITHGNYSLRRIKAAKPDYLVKDLGKIITIIEKLNERSLPESSKGTTLK